jgi:hypothetical protein
VLCLGTKKGKLAPTLKSVSNRKKQKNGKPIPFPQTVFLCQKDAIL